MIVLKWNRPTAKRMLVYMNGLSIPLGLNFASISNADNDTLLSFSTILTLSCPFSFVFLISGTKRGESAGRNQPCRLEPNILLANW